MTQPAPPSADDDPILADLIEQLTERVQAGERINESELLRQHPDHANELRDLFPALRMLRDLSRSGPDTLNGLLGSRAGTETGMLGDFRILREVGRGGMGVVYEAEQITLGRRVALKVLPFAATMDARHLQRFQNEARAAASLHHDHIVAVHAVGCERGLNYFAMQFIEGRTLADLIRELGGGSTPEPTVAAPGRASPSTRTSGGPRALTQQTTRTIDHVRRAVQWAVQAAEALEHAHAQGIVHRDVKPGNLMIDGQGKLWVTDFGLARTAGNDLTVTGDVLGTLRYMSPEQALAKHGLVDHRTDVYSLGVTLYELLTLQPAVDGKDREEMLRKIAFEEPPAPRHVEPSLPRELETILLKSIAKEPHLRYQSAEEFADDLRRFLSDQPIKARRTSAWQLLLRWRRRNPGLAAALAALVILFVLGNLLVTWQWRRERTARGEAQGAEARANRRASELQHSLYLQSIARADQEWWASDVGRAETVLDRCPPELRHWEWGHLKRLCHADLLTMAGGAGQPVESIACSSDGRHFACGTPDGTVRIFDLENGSETRVLRGHRQIVTSLAYSDDGRTLVSAASNWQRQQFGEIIVWDAATGRELAAFPQQAGPAHAIALSPDGRHIAIAGWEGQVRLIDLPTRVERALLPRRGPTVKAVAFSPDGRTFASGDHEGTIRIWDRHTGNQVRALPGKPSGHAADVLCLAYSPDGARLISGSWDHTVRVWNPSLGLLEKTLTGHQGVVYSVSVSPDGTSMASASSDGTIRLWQLRDGQLTETLRGHTREVSGVEFTPGGTSLLSAGWDGTVKLWDTTRSQFGRAFPVGTGPQRRAVYSPDGRRFVVAVRAANAKRTAALEWHDGDTGALIKKIAERPDGFRAAAIDGSGEWLACDYGAEIVLFDCQSGTERTRLGPVNAAVNALGFVGSTPLLAAGTQQGTVHLFDIQTRTLRHETDVGIGPIHALAGSDDGRFLAIAGGDGRIAVWDLTVTMDRPQSLLTGHHGGTLALAFQPGTAMLASSGRDGIVRIWNAATGTPSHEMRGHVGPVATLSFTADGRRLASGGEDGALAIWEPASGQEVLTLRRPLREGVCSVAFRPDGGVLLALSGAGTSGRMWDGGDMESPDWLARRLTWHRAESRGAEGRRNWPLAAYHLNRLLEHAPDDPDLLDRLGTAHAEMGELDLALSCLHRATERPGDLRQTNHLIRTWHHAYLRLLTGDEQGYVHECQQMAEQLTASDDGRLAGRIGACMRHAKDSAIHQKALELAERGAKQYPRDVELLFGHAIALMRVGRAREGSARLQEAVRLADQQRRPGTFIWPPSVTTWLWQSLMHHHAGQFAAARLALDRASEWMDRHLTSGDTPPEWRRPPTWIERAEMNLLRRDAEQRIDSQLRAQARTAHQQRDWAEAEAAYDRLIASDGATAADLGARARCRLERGRWDQAATDFAAACEKEPGSLDLWYRRAAAHLGNGDLDGYRRVSAEILQRFGNSRDATQVSHMTYCLVAAEQAPPISARLLALATRGAQNFPGNERLLGAARYRAGDFDGAIRAFEQSAISYKPRAWDWLFLAMCHHKLGQEAQARGYQKRALAWIVEADQLRADGKSGGWFFWQERAEVLHLRQEAETVLSRPTSER